MEQNPDAIPRPGDLPFNNTRVPNSHIFRLPNEILLAILNIVVSDSLASDDWLSVVLLIRSTCRCFRSLCSHLQIWKSPSLCTSRLEFSQPSSPKTPADFQYQGLKLLRLLKSDPIVFEALRNREEWTVSSAQMAVHLFQEFAEIGEKITRLTFENFRSSLIIDNADNDVEEALRLVQRCPNLKSLSFHNRYTLPWEIWKVGQPIYRFKMLRRLNRSIHSDSSDSGGFANLEHLSLCDWVCSLMSNEFNDHILARALKGAKTLKSLVVEDALSDQLQNLELSRFVNLTWLTLTPLHASSARIDLLSIHLPNLRAFVTGISDEWEVYIQDLTNLLKHSETFGRIRILSVTIDDMSSTRDVVWRAITHSQILPQLEYLELSLSLVSIWLEDLPRLSRLKALYWKVAAEECVISDDPDAKFFDHSDLGDDDENLLNGNWKIVTGSMLLHEAVKYCQPDNMPSLNFYVFPQLNSEEIFYHPIFELDESGFDTDAFNVSKILKINTERMKGAL
jgi:hypothetical protein